MNKQFFIRWPILFVVWMLGSFIVHGVLLHDDYSKLPHMFRSEADSQQYFPFMLSAHLIMAGAMTWIYARGVRDQAWLPQGLQFGIAAALWAVLPWYTIYYAVQPMPGMLVVKQIVFDGVWMVVLGITLGFLYRQK